MKKAVGKTTVKVKAAKKRPPKSKSVAPASSVPMTDPPRSEEHAPMPEPPPSDVETSTP